MDEQEYFLLISCKSMQEKQDFEMTPPKEWHQADREWVGGATPLFEKKADHLRDRFLPKQDSTDIIEKEKPEPGNLLREQVGDRATDSLREQVGAWPANLCPEQVDKNKLDLLSEQVDAGSANLLSEQVDESGADLLRVKVNFAWHQIPRKRLKLIKSFCRGSRGTVFSKRVPLVAEGRPEGPSWAGRAAAFSWSTVRKGKLASMGRESIPKVTV